MTRTEQKRFIRELGRNVIKELLADAGKFPDHWNGIQLRVLMADRFAAARLGCKPRGYEGEKLGANL